MTVLVAFILAAMSTGLKPIHSLNEAIYAKKAILAAVQDKIGVKASSLSSDEVQKIFDANITQTVFDMKGNEVSPEAVEAAGYKGGKAENVDMGKEIKKPESDRLLPMYVYKDGDKKFYILSVYGKGLWDAIWGNIALENDGVTIAGVDFDHKGETPGLGAEIKDNAAWKKQFIGKKIYDASGNFTSVGVIKGGATNATHEVDGISGATITADGVHEMLKRGLKYYEVILNNIKKS